MNDLINTNKYDMVIENHRNSLETIGYVIHIVKIEFRQA